MNPSRWERSLVVFGLANSGFPHEYITCGKTFGISRPEQFPLSYPCLSNVSSGVKRTHSLGYFRERTSQSARSKSTSQIYTYIKRQSSLLNHWFTADRSDDKAMKVGEMRCYRKDQID
ncbi:unnamed protein product [Cyclocybe aegerita]|uniref:Uncharacterized protein n=1 Tax=Cyclocybe aegerita TaxID=1973307 RepID=A0A8S0W596_CYCAE|nr:unnamed protein product [Cyclocybe aegerita]